MDILVIGGGGREHAIVWALAKSPKAGTIYCAPGNAGIGQLAECVPIAVSEFEKLAAFAVEKQVGLIVVGPDDPLADGIVDAFDETGIPVFGPRKNAAEIEGSKTFMKDLLHKYSIPTAAYAKFDDYEAALAYLRQQGAPIVVKADGLAAGKGVTVARTLEEAEQALSDIMQSKVFGDAGSRVVIEEFLEGQEMSILAFVDGETVKPMSAAQDHKPAYDDDRGPNTGGMGTYSPLPHIQPSIIEEAIQTIIKPTAKAMVAEGRPFRGVLFAGLMISPDGRPKTIEFNARFGDPETQVVLPRLKTDLLEVFLSAVNGTLADLELEWSDEAAVCVILASGGYPASYPKGIAITGLEDEQDSTIVFHAGTARDAEGTWRTNGGRVLGVVGLGADIASARAKAYERAEGITFEGKFNRTDIALKALR
ncbi:phosphoribosylamine--glycine ligase [Paenibacillus glucanolyticus]|jgi:phosphoribosylamine--glycine ligase|uniref:phosphoribosylamine--glycine ligase n=1 Tax=Paenibacillus TaxID=44249 RepID=UPI0003E29F13|nr:MULTISPECIES: phosphoribosylamine--glycine ligase [Paenibacillus]ANA80987.1 phosphoribosylamine--glycine ligase [Paenibacillus glucanolyticus]AVV54941.1 phosphoribosylamine--glycine ligase [Paenibacillus glucanolyticus]ETT36454.1 phosphoribosylamine--glycine ligase [Paenibacillus sp. FSL R5-808]OMF70922.1 phosphoribosylamine--glycine ligase [Paenibacillus glucanolyticus]